MKREGGCGGWVREDSWELRSVYIHAHTLLCVHYIIYTMYMHIPIYICLAQPNFPYLMVTLDKVKSLFSRAEVTTGGPWVQSNVDRVPESAANM